MRHLKTVLTVIGAVTVLVLAANSVAMATTGHSFLLGKSNSANKATSLTRTTSGTVLNLHSKASSNAPLSVNGRGKVANLNADLLDGIDSSALRPSTYVFTKAIASATSSFYDYVVPVPAGTYTVGYTATLDGAGTPSGGHAGCYLYRGNDLSHTAIAKEIRLVATNELPSFSGYGVVTIATGDSLHFYCYAQHNFNTDTDDPIQVSATRTNVVGTASLRTVR